MGFWLLGIAEIGVLEILDFLTVRMLLVLVRTCMGGPPYVCSFLDNPQSIPERTMQPFDCGVNSTICTPLVPYVCYFTYDF